MNNGVNKQGLTSRCENSSVAVWRSGNSPPVAVESINQPTQIYMTPYIAS